MPGTQRHARSTSPPMTDAHHDEQGDIVIPQVTMAQTMAVLANTVHAVIAGNFVNPEDTGDEKVAVTYVCLVTFLHQLCVGAKHKDKMAAMLQCVLDEVQRRHLATSLADRGFEIAEQP